MERSTQPSCYNMLLLNCRWRTVRSLITTKQRPACTAPHKSTLNHWNAQKHY